MPCRVGRSACIWRRAQPGAATQPTRGIIVHNPL